MNISDLIIDKEFESVIPPLTDEEFELLKESILNDGEVYHPLVVWNNIIVDGHHRYKILKEHPEVKYRIKERAFENRYEAISWICLNQLGRRNLNDAQKKMLIGRRYKTEKMARGASDGFRGNQHKKSVKGQNVPLPDDVHITSSRIATEMGTNEKTVRRAEKFVDGRRSIAGCHKGHYLRENQAEASGYCSYCQSSCRGTQTACGKSLQETNSRRKSPK